MLFFSLYQKKKKKKDIKGQVLTDESLSYKQNPKQKATKPQNQNLTKNKFKKRWYSINNLLQVLS